MKAQEIENAMEPVVARRPFTVEEYHLMVRIGILHQDDRVELIEGEIITISPIGSRHLGTIITLNRLLWRALDTVAIISIQSSFRLDEYSEPEPDVAVLHPRDDDYRNSLPKSEDAFLLIEVADTSAVYDRRVKVPMYARAGVLEVWIVNLTEDRIEVYSHPHNGAYKTTRHATRGELLSLSAFPDISLSVGDILG